MSWTDLERTESLKVEARAGLAKVKAAIELCKNNDLCCEIKIAGLVVGVCNNSELLPALQYQKKEIEKFLKGKKNEWE